MLRVQNESFYEEISSGMYQEFSVMFTAEYKLYRSSYMELKK